MVSTGENSSSSEFAAAFAALTQSGMSLEALADVRGVASWANPKPDMAYGNGTATPAMELAIAAIAYTHDAPNAATTLVRKPLTLVADNAAVGEESSDRLESEELKAAKEVAIIQIEDMIEQARMNGDEVGKARLEDILKSVKSAEKFSQLASAQSLIGQASGGKVETIEQKRERLWNEAIKAEQRAQEESHKFDAYKDKDDLDKENAAEKKYNDAVEEYERLKASGASEAELEEARKRIGLFHEELSKAREASLQGVIDNPKTPPEVREQAEQSLQEIKGHDENARQLFARAEKGNLIEQQSNQENHLVQNVLQTASVEASAIAAVDNEESQLELTKVALVEINATASEIKKNTVSNDNQDFLVLMAGDTTPQPALALTDINAMHPEAAPTFRVASTASADAAWAKT